MPEKVWRHLQGARATDALLNWETVKLFSNQAFESRQYAKAIADYQRTEYKLLASLNILNVAQSVIIFLGLASGLTVCARVWWLSWPACNARSFARPLRISLASS